MFPLAVYARCTATSTTTEIGTAAHIFCGDAVAACIASSWAYSVAVTAITAMPVWKPTGSPPLTDFAHGMAWRMNSWTASPFAWGTACTTTNVCSWVMIQDIRKLLRRNARNPGWSEPNGCGASR